MNKDVPDLQLTEKRIGKIRSEIDQFEQTFKKVTTRSGDGRDLKNEYHNLIVSTRDLSSHMDVLKKAIDAGADNPDLRIRAHDLNNQAIVQLRRLQDLGHRIQQYAKQAPATADSDTGRKSTKFAPSPFLQFDEKPTETVPTGQQLSAVLSQAEDEQQARDMEQLESDITQVNQMFATISVFVHEQGAMVESIGQNIEVAYEKVDVGKKSLDMAVKHRKSMRRKKCICLVIVVVVIVLLGLIIGFSIKS